MADPTRSGKQREIKERVFEECIKKYERHYNSGQFQDAVHYGKQALLQSQDLGKEEKAQEIHQKLYLSYVRVSVHFQQVGDSEEALKNAKLALKHCEEVDDEYFRRIADRKLALLFHELRDFGEALIIGQKWLSHFEENDDSEEKHEARRTMASTYYERALNYLNNKQFKEALGDGEQALVYSENKIRIINIRWLLVQAYFSQEDFENAVEQFDREPEMFLPELGLDVEYYIKAGKIHQKMSRFDETISYFEKAEEVANKRNLKRIIKNWIKDVKELKQKANESMKKDDIPPTLKDIGEISIENKKEIEEEQTFCHTEENIEKEAPGDEGEPHMEDITKEQCEVLDVGRTPFFEKKNMKWMVADDHDRWEDIEIICSVLEVENEKTATHHQYISYILGEAAVRVHAVDRCLVVLDEITCDFIGWYTTIYGSCEGNRKQDWWDHIKNNLKRLFGGVIKSILKLHKNHHFHGNLVRGMAVSDGQAKLFNMKPCGNEGYKKDFDDLFYMITNILDRVPPDRFFEDLADGFTKDIKNLYCPKEFIIFLKFLKLRKDGKLVDIYHPFFWPEYQQMYFLERVYDLFWKDFKVEENNNHWDAILRLEHCFSIHWHWVDNIPNEGPFTDVYNDERNPKWQRKHIPRADAIAFWRHCKTHYNDKLAVGENRKTVEEIHIQVNERFNILCRVFEAVCKFTARFDQSAPESVICHKLVELRNMVAM